MFFVDQFKADLTAKKKKKDQGLVLWLAWWVFIVAYSIAVGKFPKDKQKAQRISCATVQPIDTPTLLL